MEIRLPSTKDLLAFEAAARLGSVREAADHLCVTSSALSRRIQNLEEELGQVLFVRDNRGLTLTPAGACYAQHLQSIFQSLSDATRAVRNQTPTTLKVMAPPLYGYEMLKLIKDFESLHPHVSLKFSVYSGAWGTDPRINDADVVVAFGDGQWDGWDSVLLTQNGFSVPMCAPGYVPAALDDPRDLAAFTWIQVEHFYYLWDDWCAAAGCGGIQPKSTIEVDSGLMAKQAAASGMGIWMSGGSPAFDATRAFAGELMLAHAFHAFRFDKGFYLAHRGGMADDAVSRKFCNWLLALSSMPTQASLAK